jgi:hypothetical protein
MTAELQDHLTRVIAPALRAIEVEAVIGLSQADTPIAARRLADAILGSGVLDQFRAEAVERALSATADKWQWGAWADAPRCADQVKERIANAQFVTDWLRARAKEAESAAVDGSPDHGGNDD